MTEMGKVEGMDERKQYTDGLRAIAKWLDMHPEIPLPYGAIQIAGMDSPEDAAIAIRALGRCDKHYNDNLLKISREFGGAKLEFLFWRSKVCERRVVGTRTIPEKVIPGYEEEIVEWDCKPLLAPSEEQPA